MGFSCSGLLITLVDEGENVPILLLLLRMVTAVVVVVVVVVLVVSGSNSYKPPSN